MSLKPFSYPRPETRFFHAGSLVYKFKIRYGNLSSADDPDNTASAAQELEEAIRVILGNLEDLQPFSTDHFTIFPYLSRWERVSKMMFRYGDLRLTPYPYICTIYLEDNSFQQNVSLEKPKSPFHPCVFTGKEAQRGSSKLVKERNERTKSTETVGSVKRKRAEDEAEPSWAAADMDRTGTGCVHSKSKANLGSEMSYCKDTERAPVECNTERNAETSPAAGEMQPPQQSNQVGNEVDPERKGRSFSRFCRRIFFSPLQRFFGGNK